MLVDAQAILPLEVLPKMEDSLVVAIPPRGLQPLMKGLLVVQVARQLCWIHLVQKLRRLPLVLLVAKHRASKVE